MATISWKVDKIECINGGLGVDKLIDKVYYSVLAEETVGGVKHEGITQGFASIRPAGDNFVAFNDLDEATVISWVWDNGVDKQLAENEVLNQIERKKALPSIITEFPW